MFTYQLNAWLSPRRRTVGCPLGAPPPLLASSARPPPHSSDGTRRSLAPRRIVRDAALSDQAAAPLRCSAQRRMARRRRRRPAPTALAGQTPGRGGAACRRRRRRSARAAAPSAGVAAPRTRRRGRSIAWCGEKVRAWRRARDLHREAVEADGPASQDEDGPVPQVDGVRRRARTAASGMRTAPTRSSAPPPPLAMNRAVPSRAAGTGKIRKLSGSIAPKQPRVPSIERDRRRGRLAFVVARAQRRTTSDAAPTPGRSGRRRSAKAQLQQEGERGSTRLQRERPIMRERKASEPGPAPTRPTAAQSRMFAPRRARSGPCAGG